MLSLIVFSVDKRVSRSHFPDAWTRKLYVNIPVINIEIWNNVQNDINNMLSYLSGDEWIIEFRKSEPDSVYKSPKVRSVARPDFLNNIESVSLFSGGLDSF